MGKKKKDEETAETPLEKPKKKSPVVAGSGYEVQVGDQWCPVNKATENQGWLYYSLSDGGTGYAKPGSWRKAKK